MAKMFYSMQEAAERLNKSEDELKELVRAGSLREFRDAGKINYKVQDVDTLASRIGAVPSKNTKSPPAEPESLSAESGEIVLEPVDDSGIELAPTGSDVVTLEAVDAEDTAAGAAPAKAEKGKAEKKKGDTVVPSVGINVFDEDELEEVVDPLAQTAVTDIAGMGLEAGSGSGILDLTRESDDTSLGAELLEEIYTGEEGGGAPAKAAVGEDTRAGLDEAITEPEEVEELGQEALAVTAAGPARRAAATRVVVEYGPDPVSTALTAVMVAAVVVLWIGAFAGVALARGIAPSLIAMIYGKLWIYALGAVIAAGIAGAVTYFVSRRSSE